MATQDIWSSSGFIKANVTPMSGQLVCYSCDDNIAAAGSTFIDATPLVSNFNLIRTCPTGAGVALPSTIAPGVLVYLFTDAVAVITVYPPIGGTINGGEVNVPFILDNSGGGGPFRRFIQTSVPLTYLGI